MDHSVAGVSSIHRAELHGLREGNRQTTRNEATLGFLIVVFEMRTLFVGKDESGRLFDRRSTSLQAIRLRIPMTRRRSNLAVPRRST